MRVIRAGIDLLLHEVRQQTANFGAHLRKCPEMPDSAARQPGTYHATYGAHESVHLIDGQISIRPDGGSAVTMKPGDTFTMEPCFAGTWKIGKPVKKHFCIKLE